MRLAGRQKLAFYPLPLAEAERIGAFLQFPGAPCAAVDPCVGDGVAFARITPADAGIVRYGIELDAYRAEQARERVATVVQGDALEVHCPVESFSLLYLNPPYDQEIGQGKNRRMEQIFLSHTYRWLKPAGILVLVIPGEQLAECSQILATHFRDARVYRLSEPESVRYKQVVVLGVRRSRRERERLQDGDITQARLQYAGLARNATRLPTLPSAPDPQYQVPESGPVQLFYRGLPLDEVEDLVVRSSAYRQAGRVLFPQESSALGRPLTPLHGGHVALLATGGLLNGIFGEGKERHISHWRSVKLVDTVEETDDDGTITIREKERFANELTLAFITGEVAVLK